MPGMPAAVRLRLAHVDDARVIGVLVRRVVRRYILPDQPAGAGVPLLQTMTARRIGECIGAGFRFHVAEIDGTLVGVVAIRDDCHLHHLFVTARHQGRGIGRALWQRALADCRRRAQPARITVNASAFAVPAYLQLGFVPLGVARPAPNGIVTTPMAFNVPVRAGATIGARASAAR
jgi:GNAT superfamily N-acetyltransferase